MDITVTRAADEWKTWALTDLLGRPMGRITGMRGPGFIIEPDERAPDTMDNLPLGPFDSLDDALRAVEKRTHGACHYASDRS